MNARFRIFVVALACLLLAATVCWGIEFRNGQMVSIPAGTTMPDDLYAAGQTVNIGGTVDGDLFGVGSTVTLSGKTTHDAMLTGGTVSVTGSIVDDLRAAGGTVDISGTVGDNASVVGGTVNIVETGKIARNLAVTGGSVNINGVVGKNLLISGGQVTINGKVNGSVIANNVGQLSIGPTAVIRGNLAYTSSQKASIASGAKILGATTYHPMAHRKHRRAPATLFGLWLLSLIGAFIVGVIMLAVSPVAVAAIADAARAKPWVALLIGFILVAVVPIALIIIGVTIIGLPLALILFAVYMISLYVARIVAGLAIGRWLFARTGNPNASLYGALAVGLLILWVLSAIPILGWAISSIALLLGLGALAGQRYTMMKTLRSEGRI